MRYLVLSDVHANLEALEAVLAAAQPESYDEVISLGDLVGYGADPNGVIERVASLTPLVSIRGNHDKVASGVEDPEGFNAAAKAAALWTYGALTPENRTALRETPPGPIVVDDLVEVCHGAPFDEDAYIFSEIDALRSLRTASRPVVLFGHTHVPLIVELEDERLSLRAPEGDDVTTLTLRPNVRYLVNPGSVGQPRDGDPRAGYAIVDVGRREITLRRVAYPVEAAQEKILAAELPPILARRLSAGR
jgi:predicted phosphodiesterase